MTPTLSATPTEDQSLAFYRAALVAARVVDAASDPRTLDKDADAAWRAYGDDLPPVVRCDLVLRNFAMLYPFAFAPGPVFGLSGWYDDNPWGTGFVRPPKAKVEALFAQRSTAITPDDARAAVFDAWQVARNPEAPVHEALRAGATFVVCGADAMARVMRTFVLEENVSFRSRVVLVSDSPAARHILGIACALNRESGVPSVANLSRADGETWDAWAEREKKRLGVAQARVLYASKDASADERAAADAMASRLGASQVLEY